MKHIFQNPKLTQYRKVNRNNTTEAERKLWYYLRNKQLRGYKFQRQYSVGRYILDFYCPSVRLGIELDGGQHNEDNAQEYDRNRTEYIKSYSVQVLRFWNNQVFKETEGVLETILFKLQERGKSLSIPT